MQPEGPQPLLQDCAAFIKFAKLICGPSKLAEIAPDEEIACTVGFAVKGGNFLTREALL